MEGLSICILNYGGTDALKESLESVLRQHILRLIKKKEIIVLENYSGMKSARKAKALCLENDVSFRLLDNKDKFITGLNGAFLLSNYGNVMFMENDIILKPHCLWNLLVEINKSPNAIIQPKILAKDGSIEKTGSRWIYPGYGINFQNNRKTDLMNPSVFMMKRSTYERIGRFDENLSPAYMEDVDYSIRAKKEGIELRTVFNAEAIHWHNFTFSKYYSKKEISRICYRNRKYILRKHFSGLGLKLRLALVTLGNLMGPLMPLADGRIKFNRAKNSSNT